MNLISLDDLEVLARERLAAPSFAYISGGGWDETTLRANIAAFRRRTFRPRILRDVSAVSTRTSFLGTPVSMPVGMAPMAMHEIELGLALLGCRDIGEVTRACVS